ncbi:phosphatase PAP2 family protein [Pelomonas cellulosilytica]|uniref:Phosphatase PAP2 family protein n=1 Tax=Pelomonas cellulosilytica TaxID=2906762 RepID=A0ABS8XMX7_9BURK|nr:phosphatase PAP2 family protein [Pelomonas sp. P8]MCE4553100.1 phosphatase PAP2 family protein [Pelomonas sp. P8]
MPPWLDAGRLRGAELDLRGAQALHRAAARPLLPRVLALCSRLADGPLWAGLALLLALLGQPRQALLMLALGGANLVVYYALKLGTRRQRPFERCDSIRACLKVPDAFSFPSGHALHAFAFALLLSAFHPALAPLLWSFAVLVGLARVVLGLHFPSDVLSGALIGSVTAALALLLGG